MGKKLSEASLKKISKNHKQQQFGSMIKALRPKVYITHSSRFKKLVQELTGNNITPSSTTTTRTMSSSSSSPTPEPRVNPQNCIILEDDAVQITDPHLENSFDSFEVSASSSSSEATTTTTTSYSSSEFCFYNQSCLQDDTNLGSSEEANQCIMDGRLLAYQNLESLLFDAEVEQSFLYDYCYAQPEEQEVSTYEYELWGLL